MTPEKMNKGEAPFSVIIIHNGDKARLNTAMGSLSVFLGPSWQSSMSKIFENQPAFSTLTRKFALRRCLYSLGVALRKQAKLKKPLLGYLHVLSEHLLQIFQMLSPSWLRLQNRIFAELVLTEKHVSALKYISKSSSFGLVVEDDIQVAKEFDLSFDELRSVNNGINSQILYVSLCVAFTHRELGIQKSIQEGPPKFLTLTEGVANTTAAYWITKEFADKVLTEIESEPKLRLLAADWLITEAFSRIPEARCLYSEKGVFVNGSLFGLTTSEIRP